MSLELIINVVLLITNILAMLFNVFILGFVVNKANAIPRERDIVKQIMEAKVPVQMPPGMQMPGMNPEQQVQQDPVTPTGKKGSYFG